MFNCDKGKVGFCYSLPHTEYPVAKKAKLGL